uniref:Ubiquitin-protein ligase n=1 Tax=Solanum tuberosum TaxID=4113 RepID=M1DLS3_SOLTU
MDSIFVSNPKYRRNNYPTQNIPNDIIIDILAELPVKSLIRFKNVCRSWYSLVKDDKFIKQHYDTHKNCKKFFIVSTIHIKNQFDFYHYTMDVPQLDSSSKASLIESPVPIDESPTVYPDIQYFSSNGILLITYFDDIIVMWNPTTRESRRIPSPIQNKYGGLYNFCYFPRIDEYKIFRLVPRLVNGDMEIDIFSTKSNMWKSIGPFPPNYCFFGTSVIMVDGVIYMMASRAENRDRVITIVRFCLEKEQFQDELLLFPCMMEGRRPMLYCVGEKLCLKLVDYSQNHEFWLYMMKTNSWNKMSTMSIPPNVWLKPLSFMKDGNLMFQKYPGSFVAYNSTTHKLEQVNVTGIETSFYLYKVVTYVETLSSPNS